MESLCELAKKSHQAGDLPAAYRLYLQAVREDAILPEAWANLAEALRASAKPLLAIACYRKVLALVGEPNSRLALGELLREALQYEEAEEHLLACVRTVPQMARAWYNLALLYSSQGRIDEGLRVVEEAIRFEPGLPDIRFLRAFLQLQKADFFAGFKGYESRLEYRAEFLKMREPKWQGQPLLGKTLHVYSEQGLGDVIQFARFLRALPKDGKILFTVPIELRRLLEYNFSDLRIQYHNHGTPDVLGDFSVAIGSLAHLCFPGFPEKMISPGPYMKMPQIAKTVRRPRGITKAVGVCWAGSARHQHDRLRSATAESFARCLSIPGIELYSLQFGASGVDPALLGEMGLMQDLAPQIKDFADSAALLGQLDVVVSVDTALVHLCGALGVPCLVLIPYGALDWRWQCERSDSPWYSSLTLHRQGARESWEDLLVRVARHLEGPPVT